jgi:hypothetical protein
MTNSLKSVEGEISKVGNFFVKELSKLWVEKFLRKKLVFSLKYDI